MTSSSVVVIPARYASTRLPAKLLLEISNKPIIQYTWQNAIASQAYKVIIATDNQLIYQICKNFGAEVCMTKASHQSGTARIAEVAQIYDFADDVCVVNLQGDEPLIPADFLTQVAKTLSSANDCAMATLATKITDDLANPHTVKVVLDKMHRALYFSRSIVPYPHNNSPESIWYRHLGIYAYRVKFLKQYQTLPATNLEQVESLEQLRVLWHGYKIKVGLVDKVQGIGIDTQTDFALVKKILTK